MIYEELTPRVRVMMLAEFYDEQSRPKPYRPKILTVVGDSLFCTIMEEHLSKGDDVGLHIALSPPRYWVERGTRNTKNGPVSYFLSADVRAKTFAITDFNTWYVRGLCKVLLEEGVTDCELYRAEDAYMPRGECSFLEGRTLSVLQFYQGHRARYHPDDTKNPSTLSVPFGPNCHHSIRRIKRT